MLCCGGMELVWWLVWCGDVKLSMVAVLLESMLRI